MELKEKSIAVLGAGKSGLSAARLARAHGALVTVFDSGDPAKLDAARRQLAEVGIDLVAGEEALRVGDADGGATFDLAVLSPGIEVEAPLARALVARSTSLIGEIEFAYRLDRTPLVAITGTNGKTTTTELVAALLQGAGLRSAAAGNYGRPYSEVALSDETYDALALEVSSFQLETIDSFHPRVAVWTNFAPDHLDRYPDLESYRRAKYRVFENQQADDLAVVQAGTPTPEPGPRRVTFSAFGEEADWTLEGGEICRHGEPLLAYSDTRLQGRHNAENLMAAMAAAMAFGADSGTMADSLRDYRPPAHRCEPVAEIDGVLYLNDSKATNLHALESSLRSLEGEIVLIAGGKNKGLDYGEITEAVARSVRAVFAIGECREAVCRAWGSRVACVAVPDLAAAVEGAASTARSSERVLFSPGTSSFDMFSGYAERGDAFKTLVIQQQKTPEPSKPEP